MTSKCLKFHCFLLGILTSIHVQSSSRDITGIVVFGSSESIVPVSKSPTLSIKTSILPYLATTILIVSLTYLSFAVSALTAKTKERRAIT